MDPEYKLVSELFQDFEKCATDFASFKLNVKPKIQRLIEQSRELSRTNESYIKRIKEINEGLKGKNKELYDNTIEGLKTRIEILETRLNTLDPLIEMFESRYEKKESWY